MSTQPAPDAQPPAAQPPARGSVLTVVLFGLGGILLLPGLCSLVFALQFIATDDIVRLVTRDPYFQIVLILWGICLVPTVIGVFLIRYALRRSRARGEPAS